MVNPPTLGDASKGLGQDLGDQRPPWPVSRL